MSTEERQAIEDQFAAGEYFRSQIIRFGYLSEKERRRLIVTYPDLGQRFEQPHTLIDNYGQAGLFYLAFIVGVMCGGASSDWSLVIASIVYWALAAWILSGKEKERRERTALYWEWRGYRCNEHGQKIDSRPARESRLPRST
jgi:hypothetical protein